MKRFFACLLLAALVTAASPASAAVVENTDPDDQNGFLDLELLRSEAEKGGAGYFKIKVYDGYACNYLKESSKNYLKLLFDDGMDGDTDLIGEFTCVDNKLLFFLHGKDTGNNYEPLRAQRPKAKITKVAFQLDLAEFKANHVRVTVKAKDATNVDCDPACIDTIKLQAY